jgi:hypothetical protein
VAGPRVGLRGAASQTRVSAPASKTPASSAIAARVTWSRSSSGRPASEPRTEGSAGDPGGDPGTEGGGEFGSAGNEGGGAEGGGAEGGGAGGSGRGRCGASRGSHSASFAAWPIAPEWRGRRTDNEGPRR